MKTMCYNLGKCEVAINGLSVQVSYCRDDTDSEWTRGEAQLIMEDEVMEIGFLYSMLTPSEARKLATVLNKAAEKADEEYDAEPMYVMLENGYPMYDYDTDDYLTYFDKAQAMEECKSFQTKTNEGYEYSIRPLTKQEFWKYQKEDIIE